METTTCPTCLAHLFKSAQSYELLRGACASVGIERGRSTEDVLAAYVAEFHASHGQASP